MSHQEIHLYNTLTRSLETFVPINPQEVTIYSCGPTVYSRQHLGNMRSAFLVDLYKNILIHVGGYTVKHVMNITDVGHLTGDNEGDADHGEDRMEKGARQQNMTAWDVAEKFTTLYLQDLAALRINPFEVMPRATDHIVEQIDLVKELESKGYTYIIPGDGVYMDTSKVADYGKLIGQKHVTGLAQGARIDDAGKKNPTDFALRKFNITGKKRDMEWESPRGIGFPGWHIECSAMSMKYLGDHIDIHTGGVEHIAIHHTNEICQSECSHGHEPWVNYWLHNQWLMMNGKKIAKSDGNVAFIDDVLDHGFTAEDLRYFFLQAHYRSFQDFTRAGLEAAHKARKNLKQKIQKKVEQLQSHLQIPSLPDSGIYQTIATYLAHDFDTVKALAALHEGVDKLDKSALEDIFLLDTHVFKLGLFENTTSEQREVPNEIKELADRRRQAKREKDWASADKLRDELMAAGWIMQDGAESYVLQPV